MNEDGLIAELDWMDPAQVPAPQEALPRIRAICSLFPKLDAALLAVAATHQSVSPEVLAGAIKRFRGDTEPFSHQDVVNLLVAVVNGGRQGFEAVLRTRKATRTAAPLPWVKDW